MSISNLEALARLAIANDSRRIENVNASTRKIFNEAFAGLLKLLGPRIKHMIIRWGLSQLHDDAMQAAHIGVFKALETFDPAIAQFSTHVNFRLQAQMKDLRFHMFRDERSDALKVGARTISADAPVSADGEGAGTIIDEVEAEGALEATEASVATLLSERLLQRLLEHFERAEMQAWRRLHGPSDMEALSAHRKSIRNSLHAWRLRQMEDCSYDEIESLTGVTRSRMRQLEIVVKQRLLFLLRSEPEFQGLLSVSSLPIVEPRAVRRSRSAGSRSRLRPAPQVAGLPDSPMAASASLRSPVATGSARPH